MDPNRFNSAGVFVADDVIDAAECARLLASIAAYRRQHRVPVIHRAAGGRALHYAVIDGECIRAHLPDVRALYERINRRVDAVAGQPLVPLDDTRVSCNINITPPGGAYRWHYDRNAVTAIVYLNAVEGGETECHPHYRIVLPDAASPCQQGCDRVLQWRVLRAAFARRVVVAPAPGRMLVMRGNRCLHSVRPVRGRRERINLVMSFDRPGARYAAADRLNAYLYQHDAAWRGDPNYPRG
jgi:hypothetical protein